MAVAKDFVAADKSSGKYAQGGLVKESRELIKGGTQHGVAFARGGPAIERTESWTKKEPLERSSAGQFVGIKDRFTGGRMPADFPREAQTEEDWTKPAGVGHTDRDDKGDCKVLKTVYPHEKEGRYSYAKGDRPYDDGEETFRDER